MTLDAERGAPSANRPQSGTYGEKADLARLEQQLPKGGGATQVAPPPGAGPPPGQRGRQAPAPVAPSGPNGRPSGPTPPPGVPAALLAELGQGDAFVGQDPAPPVDPSAQAMALPPDQRVIFILDTLAQSAEVSTETREWASEVRDILLLGS